MTIITLIHGTWARGAKWIKSDSALALALESRVSDNVQIESFSWSGRNLHFMRRRAAADLQSHIRGVAARNPGAKQFLIAHSHAGNVALYALTNPDISELVSGTICLSTPFILCRGRSFPQNTVKLLGAVILLAMFFLYVKFDPHWLSGGALIVAFVIISVTSSFLLKRSLGRLANAYAKIVQSFALPSLKSNQLLILAAPGDEAAAALGASFLASMVVAKLSNFAQKLHRFGAWIEDRNNNMSWFVRLSAGIPTALLAAYSIYHAFNFPNTHVGAFVMIGLVAAFVGQGFLMKGFDTWGQYIQGLYALLLIPVLLLCALFSIPFGIDAACIAGVVELVTASMPPGQWTVRSLSAPTAKGLWHSLPYADPEAFDAIISWINEQLKTQPANISVRS